MKRTIFWIGVFTFVFLLSGLVGFLMQRLFHHPTVTGISGVAVGTVVVVKAKELERRWLGGQAGD